MTSLLGAWLCLMQARAHATTSTLTIVADSSTTSDAWVREDSTSLNYGAATDLRIRSSSDNSNNNSLMLIPLSGLSGKTVLQAWLDLKQVTATGVRPVDTRVYALTQGFSEKQATWANRYTAIIFNLPFNTPWTMPGGTHGAAWTDRALLSSSGNGRGTRFQVGPLVEAWNDGTLPNSGLVLSPAPAAPVGEIRFLSSDKSGSTNKPSLVVQYTDSPPAIARGTAEIQPRTLHSGSKDAALNLWLDVDAAATTPSGAPTGFDQLTLNHRGSLRVTHIDSLRVGAITFATSAVTWTDDGADVTFQLPHAALKGRVQLSCRVDVLAAVSVDGIDLPVFVDDSKTSGATAQSLWSGNADGVAGNGDNWILAVVSTQPVAINLTPSAAKISNLSCVQFTCSMSDAGGDTFMLPLDSVAVLPRTAGSLSSDLLFCSSSPGTVQLIACYGALRDTATVSVLPDHFTLIDDVTLRDASATPTTSLTPADTMWVDATVEDEDGQRDIQSIRFDVLHADAGGVPGAAAFGASFQWTRGGTPATWSLLEPTGTSWQVLPSLCRMDESTNSSSPKIARLAFVVGKIARASKAGEWSVRVRATSLMPASVADTSIIGLNAAAVLSVNCDVTLGDFGAGAAGISQLPLAIPSDGALHFKLLSNTPFRLDGRATAWVGRTDPLDTLHVDAGSGNLLWSLSPIIDEGGILDTAWTSFRQFDAMDEESPIAAALRLRIHYPLTLSQQEYAGSLEVLARALPFGAHSDTAAIVLQGSVVQSGLAAAGGVAEVTPHTVTAGTTGQVITVYLLPLPRSGDTGIDKVRVVVPPGYGTPVVTSVRVAGTPAAFTDTSAPGAAIAVLESNVTLGQLIEVQMMLDVATSLDPGSEFLVVYDDTSTAVAPQSASEGDANNVADGDNWRVQILAGAIAKITASPSSVTVTQGLGATFDARVADAFENPIAASVVWRVEGAIGVIGSSNGEFVATAPGVGRVVAEAGGFSDTSIVTVTPPLQVRLLSVSGPTPVVQGQSGTSWSVRIQNPSNNAVTLDTLRLAFGRAVPGDADGDFTITGSPSLPTTIAPGTTALFSFSADVSTNAVVAPLSVRAAVSGIESNTNMRFSHATVDTALSVSLLAGGLLLSATQSPSAVRPGTTAALLMTLNAANLYPYPVTLQQLALANTTIGPGSREALDGELGFASLYHDDGDGMFEADQDTLVSQASAFNGALMFSPANVWLAPASTTHLFIVSNISLGTSRESDVLDVQIASMTDVDMQPAVFYRNAWPVTAPGGLMVDGTVAAQFSTLRVGPAALNPGEVDRLAFEALLPANGYAADVLTRLSVGNAGTAVPEDDIHRLRAWIDDGDGVFTKPSERLLGTLAYTGGGRWQLTGLAQAIPAEGARMFVTVDAASTAAQSATIKLFLPSSPDPGVGMSSGNSGPIDEAVTNPSQLTLSDADRIVFGSVTLAGGTAHPGARQLPLVGMTATNTYTVPRTLTTLVFQNTTTGPGTQAERDGEAKLLTLRVDGDGNGVLDSVDVDPVVSTGFFQLGQVTFSGLALAVPAGGLRTLFLTADLSTSGARDGDVVSARVDDANGVDFSEVTAVAGLFPLDSGAGWTVDGLMAVQITNLGAAGATVGPGDGPILALDVIVPRNGYASDLLRGLRITNLGSATSADLSQAQLWRDGGDGAFSGGGDDILLGPLTPTGGDWTSPLLSTPVGAAGLRLFVSVNIAATPAETTTVRFAIPAGGVEYESTNDGPLDGVVANPEGILLSSSPLLAAIMVPRASTIGQLVTVSMAIRNKSNETVRNVAAPVLELLGTAPFTRVSGPLPAAIDIAPSTTDTISWTYTADGVGDARFSAVAGGTGDPSGLPRSAPRANSNAHRVYLAARNLDLTPVQTMPIRVNRGQRGVVPFSLTLVHPGGADASDVRVDRLRIRLEEENGAPIVPSSLLDGVEVNEGTNVYLSQTGVETSGSSVDMLLATPLTVAGTQPATISLRLNIAPSTTVPTFRVVFDDSTNIGGHDATSGAPVTVRIDGAAYPLRSELASIVAEATRIDMAPLGPDTVRTSPGQPGATLMRLSLTSPGITGITSNVRVTSLAVALTDSAGADLALPGSAFSEVRLKSGFSTVARRVLTALDADSLVLAFTPPIELAANTPLELTLVGDLTAGAAFDSYGSRLLDSARVDARDVNTRTRIPAQYAVAVVRGGTVIVEGPADTARVRGTAALPAAVVIGEADVLAITATLRHPGQPGSARLRCDGLTLQLVDDLRRPRVPAGTIGRLRVLWNGVDQADITNLPSSGDRVIVPLPGLLLEPGDTVGVEVRVDIDAAAPAGFLELVVPFGELIVRDANTGLAATLAAEAGTLLPLHSGLGRLSPPARDLAFGLTSLMPAALAGDSRAVPSARLTLRNTDEQGVGPIDVDHLVVRCADRLFVAQAIGRGAARIEAWHNGTLWAQSAPLTTDSSTATLEAGTRLTIPPGSTATVELRMVTRSGAIVAGVRLGLDRAGVGVVQPASALLAINVGPEAGQIFPMWTASGVLAEASLEASYVNFPNPFAAGREATTVAYFMPSAGRVTLRVLTARGELVTTLLDGTSRGAGLQQADRWDGRNGRGDVVVNGVYVAELDIHLDDGTSKRLRRKLAVVR